jgi:hypothetical protein
MTCYDRFCGGTCKRSAMVEKGKGPWHRNSVIIFFDKYFLIKYFLGKKKDEDKRRQKKIKLEFFKTALIK